MAGLTFYKIDQEIDSIMGMAELMNGEITEQDSEKLMELVSGKKQKVINCGYWIKNKESELVAAKERVKVFNEIIRTEQNKIDNLKRFICAMIDDEYSGKLVDGLFVLSTAKNAASVNITDQSKIPNKYTWIDEVVKFDKKAIKEDLKDGIKIPGADLISDKRNIRIKG